VPVVNRLRQPSLDSTDHHVRIRHSLGGGLAVRLDGVEAESSPCGHFGHTEVFIHTPKHTHQSACTKVLTVTYEMVHT
jgi:hypothetical protein